MTSFKKVGAWLVDYGYMLRGMATAVIHREPPAHYLSHIVAGKAPVILIPGILGKWGFMKRLGDQVSLHGHPVYIVPKLGYNVSNIPTSAKTLRSLVISIIPMDSHFPPRISHSARTIRSLIERHNLFGAILVAYSKGGLIGKYLLAHHNEDGRVSGMVAIATPFSGSAMAKLVPHDSFRELVADSEIIRSLAAHRAVNERIISIIPEYDNHVWAEKGSFLDGAAENIEVPIRGHHKVLFSGLVIQTVLDSMEKILKARQA